MKRVILGLSQPLIGKKIFQGFFEKLHFWILYVQNYGQSAFLQSSGEIQLLKSIQKFYWGKHNLVIFDVGANVGDYSIEILKKFPSEVALFSFEPSKVPFEILKKKLTPYKNAICFNVGLGALSGEFTLYSNEQSSGQSSLYKRDMTHWNKNSSLLTEEQVKILQLDEFCKIHFIEHIHFLKIDVEGNELNVLQGMESMLQNHKVDFIQFEFGVCNVDSKVFFKDFYYFLNEHYKLFRIVKDGLYPITRYHEIYEIFLTVNYLAVSRKIDRSFYKIR